VLLSSFFEGLRAGFFSVENNIHGKRIRKGIEFSWLDEDALMLQSAEEHIKRNKSTMDQNLEQDFLFFNIKYIDIDVYKFQCEYLSS